MDKLETKRMRSLGKGKVVKERAKGWEDVNGEGVVKRSKKKGDVGDEEAAKKEREWVSDEEMDQEEGSVGGDVVVDAAPQSVPLPAVEEDEML